MCVPGSVRKCLPSDQMASQIPTLAARPLSTAEDKGLIEDGEGWILLFQAAPNYGNLVNLFSSVLNWSFVPGSPKSYIRRISVNHQYVGQKDLF